MAGQCDLILFSLCRFELWMVCNLKEIMHLLNIIRYLLWQSNMSCGLIISVSSVSYRQKRGSDFPFVQAVDGIRYTDEEYNQLLADPVSNYKALLAILIFLHHCCLLEYS